MRNRQPARLATPITFFLVTALVSGCAHQVAWQRAAAQDDLPTQLNAYFASLANRDLFTGYALVARGESVLFSEGYGHAENEQGRPFTADSQFRIASVTKQFTAATILACRRQGLLSLDDAVALHHPDVDLNPSATIRHLLTHTSGLGTERAPGEAFAYSNEGYNALGSVVEAVSGMTYDAFLQAHVCRPAGLRNTQMLPFDGKSQVEGRRPAESSVGAGGLVSTGRDLLRWSRYLASQDNNSMISYDSLTEDLVPALPGVRYGFGIAIRKAEGSTRKSRLFWHAGSAPGTSASLGYLPDLGVTVVILSDSDHIDLFTIESDVYRLVIDDCITLEPCTHESAKASSRSTSSATSPALAGSWMRL